MKEIIECAYCDGKAHMQRAGKEIPYRKEIFKVVAHFYKCDKCKEEFTTTEADTVSIVQAYNQYRERYSIPFPDEVNAIREKYGLSAAKMSEVLGLGANGYGGYEKGEVPSPAIGNLISTAGKAENFKALLEKAKHYFKDGLYQQTLKKVDFLIDQEKNPQPFYVKLNLHNEASSITGYKKTNKDKIANTLILFICKCNAEFNDRLKLNKLLFYSDFINYKLFGSSITGISYRAIDYGPVPSCYDNIYTYFENEGIIDSNWIKDSNGAAKETFVTAGGFDSKLFTENESLVLSLISEKFKDTSSWDLVDLSHEEKAWIDLHPGKEIIDYQHYAFDIVGVK